MKERWSINRNPENCQPCVFINGGIQNWARCERLDQPLSQIESCETGRLLSFPNNNVEMAVIFEAVKQDWKRRKII